jgi:hypothetical protein
MACLDRFSDSRELGGWFGPAAPYRSTAAGAVDKHSSAEGSPGPPDLASLRRDRGALDPWLLRR